METETKTQTCVCDDCKKEIPLDKAVLCEICNKEKDYEDDDDDKEEKEEKEVLTKPKEQMLYCKRCRSTCFICEMIGCNKCVDTVCCDCCVSMCDECRNNDVLCGCYGKCCICRTEINRGSEGWPCGECEKWYCHDCRRGENPCKECGPSDDEAEDDE
jgi:hypothetical protein